MAESSATHRIYAIRYAHRDGGAHEHFYRAPACADPMPMAYYVWLVASDAGVVVFDTGYTRQKAEALGRRYFGTPPELLRRLGVEPDDVDHLVLSHFHFDHIGHIASFPNARITVQEEEMRFWFGPYAGVGEYPALCDPADLSQLVAANVQGRLRWLNGDADILPGVSAHLVGGHTPGSQVLRVLTERGPVVLAADASHFYANVEQNRPYAIVHTLPRMYTAFTTMRALADPGECVVPGHDPDVMARYPAPSPDLEDLVVRIA